MCRCVPVLYGLGRKSGGEAMATTFGGDAGVARQLAGELASIRTELHDLGSIFDAFDGSTGSAKVEHALDDFVSDSSDRRDKMDKLLERATGLLNGLADGIGAVDTSLAEGLTPEPEPAQ